ncbi:catalase, partial [Arthrobacter sp. ISL-30]|uniref:catalase n=1 Tax=Arthrobacter sp. ISL-30 TaxID=2819109 RepID=UPI001BE972F4
MTANISTAVSTTQSGAPVTSDAHSKSVGADGAIILTDHYLVEKLAQFNRERVPERVVHAKGGGAFGTFKTTEDSSKYTKAAFLQQDVETEMLITLRSLA